LLVRINLSGLSVGNWATSLRVNVISVQRPVLVLPFPTNISGGIAAEDHPNSDNFHGDCRGTLKIGIILSSLSKNACITAFHDLYIYLCLVAAWFPWFRGGGRSGS
jgi:hypothetical protein